MLDELKLASSMLGGFDVFTRYIFYASLGFTVLLAVCIYWPVHFALLCVFVLLTVVLGIRLASKRKRVVEEEEETSEDAKP